MVAFIIIIAEEISRNYKRRKIIKLAIGHILLEDNLLNISSQIGSGLSRNFVIRLQFLSRKNSLVQLLDSPQERGRC
jgi:hypothetical protein